MPEALPESTAPAQPAAIYASAAQDLLSSLKSAAVHAARLDQGETPFEAMLAQHMRRIPLNSEHRARLSRGLATARLAVSEAISPSLIGRENIAQSILHKHRQSLSLPQPPAAAAARVSAMSIRLSKLSCIDPQDIIGKDEIVVMGWVNSTMEPVTQMFQLKSLGKFSKGQVKNLSTLVAQYGELSELVSTSFWATIILGEQDMGGLPQWFTDLYNSVFDYVQEQILAAVEEAIENWEPKEVEGANSTEQFAHNIALMLKGIMPLVLIAINEIMEWVQVNFLSWLSALVGDDLLGIQTFSGSYDPQKGVFSNHPPIHIYSGGSWMYMLELEWTPV